MLQAQSTIPTLKASRYLKALCNHFNHKVVAEYNDNFGKVEFGFAYCEMNANTDALVIDIQAEDTENFQRVKSVISSHLERFGVGEELAIVWSDQN